VNIGDQLRSARLSKNLTIEQLSKLSRVSVKNIISFEDDDFSIDARVFVIANLNALSKILEIDLLEEIPSPQRASSPETINVLERDGFSLQRRNHTPIVMVVGLVMLFSFILYGLFTRGPQTSEPLPEISITSSPSPSATSSVTGGVSVLLTAESRSWVSVKNSSNQIIFERIMETGEQLTFNDALSLVVTVGNAAGINITVNDENVGYLGGIGQVVTQIFTSPDSGQ
jgi:cytoskeletal protein RodZ